MLMVISFMLLGTLGFLLVSRDKYVLSVGVDFTVMCE